MTRCPRIDAGLLLRRSLLLLATLLGLVWTLFPFYWGIVTSLKAGRDTFGNLWLPWLTFQPTLLGWRRLLAVEGLAGALLDSALIAIGAATIATLLGTAAGYGIARYRFPGRWQVGLILWFVLQRVLPPILFLPPYLLLLRAFGLTDTVAGLVLINAAFNLPLVAIVMSGAFRDLPRELEEAAAIDGASRARAFLAIAVPLVVPAIAASWLLALAFAWNEWMFASAVGYTEAKSFPVLIQATGGGGGVNYQAASTRALAAMALPLVAALLAQRWLVRALSLGAVKG